MTDQSDRRITKAEVLAKARFSEVTLYRRMKAGQFPTAIDRGIWLESEVDRALGLRKDEDAQNDDPWAGTKYAAT